MKPGYLITTRGLNKFNEIIVHNYSAMNLVDMVKWDNSRGYPYECVVAIFKIKWKWKN